MYCLPLYPLLLGILPFSVGKQRIPDGWARQFWHCGVATFMVGSCLTGIFEIAGVHMLRTRLFLSVGFLLLVAAVVIFLLPVRNPKSYTGRHAE